MKHSRLSRTHRLPHSGLKARRPWVIALRKLPIASAVSAALAGAAPLVLAANDAPAPADTLQEVTVTAQKVTENLQNVPIAIDALGSEKLQQLNVTSLDSYVEYLAGVTTIKSIDRKSVV